VHSVKKLLDGDKPGEERNPPEGTNERERGILPDFIVSLRQSASKLPNVREMAKQDSRRVPLGQSICDFTNPYSVQRLWENDKSGEEMNPREGTNACERRTLSDFIVSLPLAASRLPNVREIAKQESMWMQL
jgi:hypothetical protein